MNEIVEIEGKEVERIEYKNQHVVTYKTIDHLHDRPEGTAKRTFSKHRDRFEMGYHYFEVPYEEWSQIPAVRFTYAEETGQRNPINLFTEAGYLLLVKPFRDDRAWRVQDRLIKYYFAAKKMIHEEKIASFTPLAREFYNAKRLAVHMGLPKQEAVWQANEAVKKLFGHDCARLIGAEAYVFPPSPKAPADPVAEFIGDCCIADEPAQTGATVLYTVFQVWWRARGYKRPPAQKWFGRVFSQHFDRAKVSGTYRYYGVRLLNHLRGCLDDSGRFDRAALERLLKTDLSSEPAAPIYANEGGFV